MFGISERRLPDCKLSSYFLQYANNITSQGGEDGILDKIFELIDVADEKNPRYCIDIGAWDGKHLSNTYNLINACKWSGLLIEADEERHQLLRSLYSTRSDVICLNCLVDVEGDRSLINILKAHQIQSNIDFLSIDIDGADYHIWDSLQHSSYRPRVVCIEFNPTIPNHVYYIQERDAAVQEGSSLLAISELGYQLGYQIVATTTFNAIFVRYDLLIQLPKNIFTYCHSSPNSSSSYPRVDLNSLHAGSMITDLFQTYTGEIKLCGPKKLLWHRIPMNIQQMQAIKAKKDRIFPFAPRYNKITTDLEENRLNICDLLNNIIICIRQQSSQSKGNNNSSTKMESTSTIIDQLVMDLNSTVQKLIGQCSDIFGIINSGTTTTTTTTKSSEKKPLQGICTETLLHIAVMIISSLQELTIFSDFEINNDSDNVKYISIIEMSLCENINALSFCMQQIGDLRFELYRNGTLSSKRDDQNTVRYIIKDAKRWFERSYFTLQLMNNIITPSEMAYDGTDVNRRNVDSLADECYCSLTTKISRCCLLLISDCAIMKGIDSGLPNTDTTTEDFDNIFQGLQRLHVALQHCNNLHYHPSIRNQQNSQIIENEHCKQVKKDLDKLQLKWIAKLYSPSSNVIEDYKNTIKRGIPLPSKATDIVQEDSQVDSHNNVNITAISSLNSFYCGFGLGIALAVTVSSIYIFTYMKANK